MRVVLDTNVIVSALIFPGGAPEAVYRLALAGRLELLTSRPLLAELGRVLTDKFGWETGPSEEAVAQIVRAGTIVEPLEVIDEITADPADNRVLEAGAAGSAGFIVSGDRHLGLGSWGDIRITSPGSFLVEFQERGLTPSALSPVSAAHASAIHARHVTPAPARAFVGEGQSTLATEPGKQGRG